MTKTGTLATAINIFAAPNEAFAAIRERAAFLFPLLLVCATSAIANGLYSLEVDIAWLTEQQLRSQTFIDLTDAQIEQQAAAAAERGPGLSVTLGLLSVFVIVPIIFLLQSLYLKIVSLVRKDQVSFRRWFSLISWASLPAVLGAVATIVYVVAADVRFVDQASINPLSFANLLGLDTSEAGTSGQILASFSPINIWSLVLVILGHRFIAGASLPTSALVVLVPAAAIIIGITALP